MSKPTLRSWTFDECITDLERRGFIKVPFSEQERALAWSIGAAWHFVHYQEELPGRCLEKSRELGSLDMGIIRVKLMLEGEISGSIAPRT
jgi:hypothetical protein